MNNKDNTPNAGKLMDSLRFVGYDNYSAIADLVDNSIDAFAGLIKIDIGTHEKDHLLVIADNGIGMGLDTLDQAMRLGSKTTKDPKTDLGKYGLGLITASISIGELLRVITKKDGHYLTAVHDLEKIRSTEEFVREIRPSTDQEMNFFIERLGGSVSGTIILISKIDRLQNKNLTIFRNTLISHLGEIFREYINAGKRLIVNNKEVRSRDPLMREHSETDELINEERQFTLSDGSTADIHILAVCLPKFSEQEEDDLKINQRNQGFYIMRNRRQIAGGETLGIFTRHNSANRFRAEFSITGEMDSEIGASFTKDEIKINDSIRGWVDKLVSPQIAAVKARSKKNANKLIADQVDHSSSERIFKARAKLLLSRPSTETEEPEVESWRMKHIDEAVFLAEQKGRLAPLFEYNALTNRKIEITFNADHPFYTKVFENGTNNPDLANAIDFMAYSIAQGLSRITTEKTIGHVDDFLVTFSENLRTLLSS